MGVSGQSHTTAAIYPREKDPRYPLDKRLGGPQSRTGHRLEETSFAPARDRTSVVQSVVRHYTAWATRLPGQQITLSNIDHEPLEYKARVMPSTPWCSNRCSNSSCVVNMNSFCLSKLHLKCGPTRINVRKQSWCFHLNLQHRDPPNIWDPSEVLRVIMNRIKMEWRCSWTKYGIHYLLLSEFFLQHVISWQREVAI
jgi:hypothetical protein